jgi:hypothetical protein
LTTSRSRLVGTVLWWRALVGLVLIVAVGACGSDSDDTGSGPADAATSLAVTGVATTAASLPNPDPGTGTEVPFSGTLRCTGADASGTGAFADDAVRRCAAVVAKRALLTQHRAPDNRACAELYGGPQHARINGVVAGQKVDVTVTRTDGCGIDDWEKLVWLLGPPER